MKKYLMLFLGLVFLAASVSASECRWCQWKKKTPKVEVVPASYWMAGLSGTFLGDQDAASYFGHGEGTYFRPSGNLAWGLSLPVVGLELGWDFGPYRTFDETFAGGGGIRARWSENGFYLMPMLHGAAFDWSKKVPTLSALGFKFGWPSLNGQVDTVNGTGAAGHYDQTAHSTLFGLAVRNEAMLGGRWSLGFEWGYNWERFDGVDNSALSGTLAGAKTYTGQETNLDGSKTALDFSGWFLKLTVAGWDHVPVKVRLAEEKKEDKKDDGEVQGSCTDGQEQDDPQD
jgi:hypothetical protein